MAIYPPGVQLSQLSIGPVTDMFGDLATLTVAVTPIFTGGVTHITHTASGHSVAASTKQFISADATGIVTFAVPATNETGWQDPSGRVIDVSVKPGWKYLLKVNATIGRQAVGSWTKEVQPLVEQTGEIDVDLVGGENILEGVLGPTAVVTSIGGKVGTVTVADLEAMGVGSTGNLQIGTVVEGATTEASITTDAEGNKLLNLTLIPGVPGETGQQGEPGPSAYQHWLNLGNTGTEQDFINSINGTDGVDGADGQDAYQLWLQLGNTGTEQDFLNSLVGPAGLDGTDGTNGSDGVDGRSAYQVWLDQGNTGTVSDYLEALRGPQGLTGDQGPEGPMGTGLEITGSVATRTDLDTLPSPQVNDAYVVQDTGLLHIYDGSTWSSGIPFKGEPGQDGADGTPGADGQSAYELWQSLGNVGTEQQFLDSLVGTPGADGTDGAPGADGADGRGITSIVSNGDGTATITYTDGATAAITLPAGQDGADGTNGSDGVDGRSVTSIVANGDGTATITYSDSTTGQLTLPAGRDGADGTNGADGKSAYQIWLDAGNSGTEADFLASLEGADGQAGADGIDGESAPVLYTPFIVRYSGSAWPFATLAAAVSAGLNVDQVVWFVGPAGVNPPTWARTNDMWTEA